MSQSGRGYEVGVATEKASERAGPGRSTVVLVSCRSTKGLWNGTAYTVYLQAKREIKQKRIKGVRGRRGEQTQRQARAEKK